MTSDSIKLYKLIILYFLSRTKHEVTNAILSDFILEHGYTDYFSIQETLASLTEDEMILANQTHTACYYTITKKGMETLSYFASRIPRDTVQQIKDYLTKHKMEILDDASIRTDYTQISSSDYMARCTVMERGITMVEVSLNVPTEEDAIEVCRRFKAKSDIIYSFLFKELSTN